MRIKELTGWKENRRARSVSEEMKKMSANIDVKTIIRTGCLIVALVNMLLQHLGYNVLPFTDEQISGFISDGAAIAAALWTWWKNNNFTVAAKDAQKALENAKATDVLNKNKVGQD